MENKNNVTKFVLLGLTENPKMHKVIFVVFLVTYTISLVGNVLIVVTITASPLLGSPMYFFLTKLSFTDACYSSVNTPKLITDSLHVKMTTFDTCVTQVFGDYFIRGADVILLTVMAYDHYVTISKALHYKTIMNWQVCGLLMGVVWVRCFLHAAIQILFIIPLPFCGPNIIDHFMCDLNPLLNLACTDTHTLGLFVAANSGFICPLNCLLLMVSYLVILCSLENHNLEARHRALSTCVSHITVVVLFFVLCVFVYMRPAATLSIDKAVAVFYTITPILNPLIYTLRNDQMKNAIRKLCSRKVISSEK
ncbi:olfactory receptor 4C46-like [Mustela lutreola]|nr:olfactory receptor 4C46-like [Mustela lutreola]